MKRVAIMTTGEAPVAREMAEMLNSGHRYRVGNVPADLVQIEEPMLVDALKVEGVDMLILENCSRQLSEEFPIAVMVIEPGETAIDATRRLMSELPDYDVERQWAETLHENFDESRTQTPPPVPPAGAVPPVPESQPQPAPQPMYQQMNPQMANPSEAAAVKQEHRPMPKTYMLWAVLATILFSLVPGVVAIVYSTLVSSRYFSGDYEGAKKASRLVEIWTIASIVIGVITSTLYLPMMLLTSLA